MILISLIRTDALKVSKPKYELMALLIVLAIHAEWETGELKQYKNHRRHENNEKSFERRSRMYEKKEK